MDTSITINMNTILSVGAVLGVSVLGIVQKRRQMDAEDIKERIKEVRDEQTRMSDRIDRIYDKLVNGKGKEE